MERQWERINRGITVNPDSIVTQEMRGDGTALVAVSYALERDQWTDPDGKPGVSAYDLSKRGVEAGVAPPVAG